MEHEVCPAGPPTRRPLDRAGPRQQKSSSRVRTNRTLVDSDTYLGRSNLFPVRIAHKTATGEPVSKPSAGSRTADASKSLSMRKIVGWFVASIVLVLAISARAFAAAPAASIPTGPFTDGQVITVSGSGFPTHSQDPAGLQIIECSDPQGSAANLPTDAGVGCEGISVNAGQINTDSAGKFRTAYLVAAWSTKAGTSSIDCDAAHYCVLWVGTDYNNAFTSGPHAFTTPFEVNENTTTSTPPSQTNT